MREPPNFATFSKKIDEEMKLFANYMMTRALANDGELAEHYMIMLTTLTRGVSLLELMLEEEGLSKHHIELALSAMKHTNDKLRVEYERINRQSRTGGN